MPVLNKINYLDTGSGKALILIHGFLGSNTLWVHQIKELKKYFRVIAIDLPGYGKSNKAKSLNKIKQFSGMIERLLKKLKINNYYLIGHSMGGMIAQEIAAKNKNIKKVILHATGPIGEMPGRFETIQASRNKLKKNGVLKQASYISKTWFVKGDKNKNYNICKKAYKKVSYKTADLSMKAMQDWNGIKNLKKISIPTLITWGNQDKSYNRAQVEILIKNIKNSKLKVFNNCAHNVHLEKIRAFNKVVLEFLKK